MKKPSRRTVLGAGTAFSIVPRHVLGGRGYVPPSEKVNVAVVGIGGRGLQNARSLMELDDVQIIAVADPAEHWNLDAFYYKGVAGRKPGVAEIKKHYNKECSEFEDFRVMLDQRKDIDAILCATPDHLHAYVALTAMKAGRHVYCEKPLTHNIEEARRVAQVARETKRATQLGNQGHSTEGIRATCELIWAGAIGPVREVHAWVPATRWNPGLKGKPAGTEPLPAGLNWDLWSGPRDPKPFHTAYAPVTWRDFWTFGCGALGDFGCHDLDAACWALDLHAPEWVEARPAGYMDKDIAPYGEMAWFHFGARGDKPPVRITWYSGGLKPPRPEVLPAAVELPSRGVLFVGDTGILVCGGAGGAPAVYPGPVTAPAPTLPRSKGHHRDWIDAIKGGPPASSNFEYGARLTEITLLGLAALRTGKKLVWDPAAMAAKDVPEAEDIFRGTYRKGWELP